jgi:hypothetical protein
MIGMMAGVNSTWMYAEAEGTGDTGTRPEMQSINQFKIRWALGTFKPFKQVGTDEFVWALLQQEMQHLAPHLCCTFRAWYMDVFLWPGDQ